MVVATVTTTLKTPPPPKKPQRNEKPNRASPPPLPTPNHLQIPPVAAPRKSTPPSKSKHTYQNIPISPNNTQENGKTPSDHKVSSKRSFKLSSTISQNLKYLCKSFFSHGNS